MSHVILFRRPETPYGVSKVCVPREANAARQLQRLESLGYVILDVTPPLAPTARYMSGTRR